MSDDWLGWRDALEKAHEALRRAPRGGVTSAVPTRERYRGGQFIDRLTWQREMDGATQALPGLLQEFDSSLQFLRQVYEQQVALGVEGTTAVPTIPLSTIEARMKSEIRTTYARAFLLGKRAAGNLTSATAEEQAAVMRLRRDEYRYLRGFLGDMRSGGGRMSYERRMEMYGAAARELYWLGWAMGDTRPGRMITWRMGATEHCGDCLRYSEHGPYSVEQFLREVVSMGHVPQSGALDCKGFHCQCWLQDGRLPGLVVDIPASVAAPVPVASPKPKPKRVRQTRLRFTMPKEREEVLEADFTEPDLNRPALPAKPRPKPAAEPERQTVANVQHVMPLKARDKQLIRVLGLPPIVWLRLDRAKVRTIGQLRKYTAGDLVATGMKPDEAALVRRALAAYDSVGQKGP